MGRIQKTLRCVAVVSFVVLFGVSALCADSPKGKAYYTKANIWYERPGKILSTNYHRGAIIPAGATVKIVGYGGSKIRFSEEETGVTFTLIHARKHTTISFQKLFERYFSESNVMAAGGDFHKFTKQEQENIENGTITEGMAKEAVLMAYGYPPSHRTPRLSGNVWNYWKSRYVRVLVSFKDNKVLSIEEIDEDSSRRPRWYDYAF